MTMQFSAKKWFQTFSPNRSALKKVLPLFGSNHGYILMPTTCKMTIWLVAAVVLLQSFMATAGSLDVHTYDPEHAQNSHIENTETLFFHHEHEHAHEHQEYSHEEHSTDDCHHCGHCTGMHLNWVTGETHCELLSAISITFPPFISVKLPIRVSELLRPPIA